ncbi:zinc finger homeobox protein 3 [Striga asiatica]|uniref:Zinc finger homeobox protein 3 n=1 Tax=Striga asiatica TaxID=4170 RepID=A0A5A7Q9V0_STRAF|nr:zinc finger homeobox protein 3 [Striga asiatica]
MSSTSRALAKSTSDEREPVFKVATILHHNFRARMELAFPHSLENEIIRPHQHSTIPTHFPQSESQIPPEPPFHVRIHNTAISHEIGTNPIMLHMLKAQVQIPHQTHPRESECSNIKRVQIRTKPGLHHPHKLSLQTLHLEFRAIRQQQKVPKKIAYIFPSESHIIHETAQRIKLIFLYIRQRNCAYGIFLDENPRTLETANG